LAIAIVDTKFASLVSDSRSEAVGEVEFKHFWFRPSIVSETEFTVSLSSNGRFLGEYKYMVKLAPFPDVRFA
jgi:hypothetical protein